MYCDEMKVLDHFNNVFGDSWHRLHITTNIIYHTSQCLLATINCYTISETAVSPLAKRQYPLPKISVHQSSLETTAASPVASNDSANVIVKK